MAYDTFGVTAARPGIVAQELLDRPTPPGTDGRRALPVAGDDERAYQPGTPAYGPDVDAAKLAELLNGA